MHGVRAHTIGLCTTIKLRHYHLYFFSTQVIVWTTTKDWGSRMDHMPGLFRGALETWETTTRATQTTQSAHLVWPTTDSQRQRTQAAMDYSHVQALQETHKTRRVLGMLRGFSSFHRRDGGLPALRNTFFLAWFLKFDVTFRKKRKRVADVPKFLRLDNESKNNILTILWSQITCITTAQQGFLNNHSKVSL